MTDQTSDRALSFLCAHHRQLLCANASKAKRFWGETILAAREQVALLQWHKAMVIYGNAMEVADILLSDDDDRERAEIRYSRTAVEFTYALRQLDRRCDVNILVQMVSCELQSRALSVTKATLLNPLIEAASCSREDAGHWVATRLATQIASRRSLH